MLYLSMSAAIDDYVSLLNEYMMILRRYSQKYNVAIDNRKVTFPINYENHQKYFVVYLKFLL